MQPVSFAASVYNVMIASPGDTHVFRDAVEHSLYAWNRERGTASRTVLMPRRWETDAVPALGEDAQSEINHQLVDEADAVIGLFYSRLGSATARAASGTAEEILRAHEAGKQVHVYFAKMEHPADVDVAQLTALRAFKSELFNRGLMGEFVSAQDLKDQIRRAVEKDVAGWAPEGPSNQQGDAFFRVRGALESHGRLRGSSDYLELTNVGGRRAEAVWLELAPAVPTYQLPPPRVPRLLRNEQPDIEPSESYRYLILSKPSGINPYRVLLTWRQTDQEFKQEARLDV